MKGKQVLSLVSLILLALHVTPCRCQGSEGAWTDKLGEELWHLSKLVTKYSDIVSKYRPINARVVEVNGTNLLSQTIQNISKMLQKKMEAVRCLMSTAESIADTVDFNDSLQLDYFSMKYSPAEGGTYLPTVPWELDNMTSYINMTLSRDRHFYNVPVNTDHSAVHIPTNLYDRYPKVAEAIMWSENLDDVFIKNYQADPGLSWQYFGAATGMMRQYPAMQWVEDDPDLYDCRTRPWFIEAATCTKDVIILMDNSGSMTGMRNTIAKSVVTNLLGTFGSNDFINVLNFSWTAEPLLDCFNETLAQATTETVKLFQDAVAEVVPLGNASFPKAFTKAFRYLEKARDMRSSEGITDSNQAIMLITDGLPGNITDVFERYNPIDNGYRPVRVFTYLVGQEVRGVQEIQLMACENRGYYVHIHNLDEVRDQVLRYIPVVARPLVLQSDVHPVMWTHVFADVSDRKLTSWLWEVMKEPEQQERLRKHLDVKSEYKSEDCEDMKYVRHITQVLGEEKIIKYQEYRLMTSVSTPVFDRREHNDTDRIADLLGIVGTDVPIQDLFSLTYPYKIGANGYAFIVTNNGYILMHPDLRPVYQGILKLNYNSVDLVEIEFADDDAGYKNYSADILRLREKMVTRLEDEVLEVDVKFHYDDMRRVGVEKRDYHISALPGTPFSIGLAFPSGYGKYQIGIADEVQKNFHQGIPLDKDFRDKEWKIHPDWTYCKYHFAIYERFDSPEEELLHFLQKMTPHTWKWKYQYPDIPEGGYLWENDSLEVDCDRLKVDDDAFYCDKDLIQLLVFDSKVIDAFRNPKLARNSFEEKQLKTYNATLRFMSTQSGLTRWQEIPKPEGRESNSAFGDAYPRAIDEPWYKAAVLQHQVDPNSFVFSVPFNSAELDDIPVTATFAIFPIDGGKKAPASVVGYQMTHESLYNRVVELTSKPDEQTEPCSSDSRACYILDHNGYIVISLVSKNNTGQFFGEVEPQVMSELVSHDIYRTVVLYDYQALCIEEIAVSSDATSLLLTPYLFIGRILEWIVGDLLWSVLQTLIHQTYYLQMAATNIIEDSDDDDFDYVMNLPAKPQEEVKKPEDTITIERNSWPCDKNRTLYLLQQTGEWGKALYPEGDDTRLHYAGRISHTNLLLVVVHTLRPLDSDFPPLDTVARDLPAEECHRSNLNQLPRQRLTNCFTYHPREEEIEACGGANSLIAIRSIIIWVTVFSIMRLFCRSRLDRMRLA